MMKKRATLTNDAATVPSANNDLYRDPDRGFVRDESKYNARHGKPTTYRLPVDLVDRIREIAQDEGVGLAEFVQYILTSFVRDYESGKVRLPKQQQQVYTLNIPTLDTNEDK